MTDLEKIRQWIATYPDFDILGTFRVDYTDQAVPGNGGLFPTGLVEVARVEDILGNVTVTNQYNFGLYTVFAKSPGDDIGAAINADWVMGFQRWVQEQSVRGLVPRFGNTNDRETAQAQNGVLYEPNGEGTAVYMVQLNIRYKTFYEVN